mmetsp:Transcript_38349/g.90530  ORF Transcript_38349/g.90530 Transcript_38349/m.90530 type:complete len:224 (+) Transcript_38349:3542-4213(+)
MSSPTSPIFSSAMPLLRRHPPSWRLKMTRPYGKTLRTCSRSNFPAYRKGKESETRNTMSAYPPGSSAAMEGIELNSIAFLQARTAALVMFCPCWSAPNPVSIKSTRSMPGSLVDLEEAIGKVPAAAVSASSEVLCPFPHFLSILCPSLFFLSNMLVDRGSCWNSARVYLGRKSILFCSHNSGAPRCCRGSELRVRNARELVSELAITASRSADMTRQLSPWLP